jgi:hypothetical protein
MDAAIGPFDPAVAGRDIGFAVHYQPPGKRLCAGDVVDLFARRRVKSIVDPDDDVRRGHELAEAAGGGNFGERLAFDQVRRKLAGHRDRDLDGFAFEPRFDRLQRGAGRRDAGRDAFERAGDPPADLDLGVALALGIAAWRAESSAAASVVACSASVTVGLRRLPVAKSTSNRNFAGAPISRSAPLRRASSK